MKLLIVTQKVDINDDVLGFMHGWLREFARCCEKVTVICLFKGEYNLPENVKVLSLGKEGGDSRLKYLFNFYRYIWQERKNYEAVFVHMNPEYIVLGGIWWKLWHKKVALWYAHGYAPFNLKIAEKFADIIFTSTESGCRLKSQKIRVVGQGINMNNFQVSIFNSQKSDDKFRIVSIGRISPSKDYETLINAMDILRKEGIDIETRIIGGTAISKDFFYKEKLQKMTKEKKLEGVIRFIGSVPNRDIVKYLKEADLFINTSQTGSLDKAVLEAMAVGIPVLTSNEAFAEILEDWQSKLMFKKKDSEDLAEKIKYIINLEREERLRISMQMRKIVEEGHSLEGFVRRILDILKQKVLK